MLSSLTSWIWPKQPEVKEPEPETETKPVAAILAPGRTGPSPDFSRSSFVKIIPLTETELQEVIRKLRKINPIDRSTIEYTKRQHPAAKMISDYHDKMKDDVNEMKVVNLRRSKSESSPKLSRQNSIPEEIKIVDQPQPETKKEDQSSDQ